MLRLFQVRVFKFRGLYGQGDAGHVLDISTQKGEHECDVGVVVLALTMAVCVGQSRLIQLTIEERS